MEPKIEGLEKFKELLNHIDPIRSVEEGFVPILREPSKFLRWEN
ncbi:hypothetical protein ACFL6A_00400 [bacterium]